MKPVASQDHRNLRTLVSRRLPSKIFNRLREIGALADAMDAPAYLVGGLVRDLLLGHTNLDVDIAVEGDGMTFARRLADRYGAGLKIFEKFATALVVFPDGFKLDVATTRCESYAHPTALPTVKPSSIKDDLYRRDFTINALAIRLNVNRFGELVDLYGGLRDLEHKVIRVLHARSFVDDPTRVFRAIRFEQRFGFRIEKHTLTLLKEAAASDLVHRLSGPRLRNEVMRLLSEQAPIRTIRRMAEFDLLRFLHTGLAWTARLAGLLSDLGKSLAWWTKQYPRRSLDRALVYFIGLMDELSASATGAVVKRLAMPGKETRKVQLVKKHLEPALRFLVRHRSPRPSETYRALADLPDEGLVLLVAKARSKDIVRLVSAHVTTQQQVRPSLNGVDLKAMGLKPGPIYKKILDRLLEARLNGEVKTKADERELAKKLAKV
ncbi:MAG: CCA tRNA nucleotidyltransferase [Nitrospirae bacterium]|nr:MAG: CCA tRNA nucleotidyltransferase [Nitrospirota bacterium]